MAITTCDGYVGEQISAACSLYFPCFGPHRNSNKDEEVHCELNARFSKPSFLQTSEFWEGAEKSGRINCSVKHIRRIIYTQEHSCLVSDSFKLYRYALRYYYTIRASVVVFIPVSLWRLAPSSERLDWNKGHNKEETILPNCDPRSSLDGLRKELYTKSSLVKANIEALRAN